MSLIPGAERSGATLEGHPAGDITAYIWPNYRRVTAAAGGDVKAAFTFGSDDSTLETWFYEYLANEFTELYQGRPTFQGRIHTMRLAYNRLVLTMSLDWLYNRVACQYTSALDNSTLITSFYSDTASMGAYGTREYIIRPTDQIGLAEAEALAQEYLDNFSRPRVSRGKLDRKLGRGSLQVTVQGYSQTADAQLYNYITPGEDDASNEVAATLAGLSFLTVGEIFPNTTQVSIVSDYRRRLKRIEAIAGRRDAQGRIYNYGAIAGKVFNYQPVAEPTDPAGFNYDLYIKRPYIQHFNGANYVPAPLVVPGGWSRIVDMRRPANTDAARKDPLNQFDSTVTYDRNGATLQGGGWSERERAEAIQMRLINQRSV